MSNSIDKVILSSDGVFGSLQGRVNYKVGNFWKSSREGELGNLYRLIVDVLTREAKVKHSMDDVSEQGGHDDRSCKGKAQREHGSAGEWFKRRVRILLSVSLIEIILKYIK